MHSWTEKLAIMERDAVRQRMALKDRMRQAMHNGLYVEAGQIQAQLRAWEKEMAKDNGGIPQYEEY